MADNVASHGNVTPLNEATADGKLVRQPPRNEEIEAALLGALLRNNRAFEKVGDILKADYFFAPEHQCIYLMIKNLVDAGQEARPTTLAHIADAEPILREVGGSEYLYELAANVVTVINAADYAQTIADLYLKRELIGLGEDVVNDAYDLTLDEDAARQIEKVEHRLYNLATSGELDRGVTSLKDAAFKALEHAEEAYKRDSHVVGVTSGFRDIDNMLGGLHGSDLIILAGRPAMGKTALVTTMAYNAAKAYRQWEDEQGNIREEGGKVLFFSLEMSADQLAGRILSGEAGVSGDKIRRGDIDQEDFTKIAKAANVLAKAPLFIDDTPALSITGMRQRARRVKRQMGLHMVIVDYLQLLQGPPDKKIDNRVQEVSEITRGLKTLAKELEIPVIALSQLSRQVENREDKRPQLSDLRESGSIEQDADVVSFVYRPEYYLQKEHPEQRPSEPQDKFLERLAQHESRLAESRNVAEYIIAKQRHGPVGTVELFFDNDYARFGDLDRHHNDDEF
ncbi:replicative DNA helicase [Aestuariispira insulae]|uniref:Replicative DNA helicase n=1 Tax=Aestuariispira insulae TaxID=1461337 RepID=A0A3D9HVM3_9PROT|nr:replicative DNA helicase [Aestuariispira insulae]RED53564.1 replicative DNA helicase [Aestuariispira insulae]